ncbi:MliC family protein [Sodalis sp. C49]|uniref:MliC family protein n=1 Tax=unclassified Sodalis (in: enterobacteria) TaxID=2636512 RepID=UPI003965AAA0
MINRLIIFACVITVTACSQFNRGPGEQTLRYQCGTTPLTVRQRTEPAQVSFILDGKQLNLPQVMSASGTRYSDGHYTFWSKGPNAFVEREGKVIINDCIIAG